MRTKHMLIISMITILVMYTEEQFIVGAMAGMRWKLTDKQLRLIIAHDFRRRQFLTRDRNIKEAAGGSKLNSTKNQDMPIPAQTQENFRKAEKEARKAAEEAEKKKKVNEDAYAEEEQERKRKAEQDRKNAEDAERLRNEEARGDGCSYKSFLNCKTTEFHGDSDPVIVTNCWLKEIEDIFEISECSRGQWLKYASHLLKGEARHWWNMIKIARGNEVVSAMTCEQFEELVMENYCPQGLMDKLEEEFLKLQNDMTVSFEIHGEVYWKDIIMHTCSKGQRLD